tara:strand:- start:177 stop:767 length:591 start_codon:yes stop_codon:yes gene_type:complete
LKNIFDFVPKTSIPYLKKILVDKKIIFLLKNKRKTKHGDFRITKNKKKLITLNKTKNKYQFLITLLHEIAHYDTYIKYQNSVKPHGIEWKNNFRFLMLPVLNNYIFPNEILNNLINYIKNPKASTENDFNLIMSLKKYDFNINSNFIFELKEGDFFMTENGKKYKFIRKRIKRFESIELESGRKYLFSPQAEVHLI